MSEHGDFWVKVYSCEEIGRIFNELCFVCSEPATTEEHVPPGSIGGRVLLRSCERCNNELGRLIDAPLARRVLHKYEGRMVDPSGEMPGRRRIPVQLEVDENRNVTSVATAFNHDRDLTDFARRGGEFEFMFPEPDAHAVQCGLIKSCYLAESVLIGRPLRGGRADSVRAQLMAIAGGGAPDASTLGDVEVIYAPTSVAADTSRRPSCAVGIKNDGSAMPLISFGRYACSPVFADDPELAELIRRWPCPPGEIADT